MIAIIMLVINRGLTIITTTIIKIIVITILDVFGNDWFREARLSTIITPVI